jgi:glycosyltransferase involved in cell wall biosynthesis
MKDKVLIIIPAFNEEKRLGKLLKNISSIISLKDVLVVDDGSQDKTAIIAKRAGSRVLSQKTNQGKGLALRTGFDFALKSRYDAVITMDADGQHDPCEIPKFLAYYEKYKTALIIGTRKHDLSEMPFPRFMANTTSSLVASILAGVRVHDSQSGYRFIRKNLIEKINLKDRRFQMETEIIVKAAMEGFSIGEMPIKTIYFEKFKSHINPFVDTVRFIILSLRMLWR